MRPVVPEIIGDIRISPFGLGVRCVGVGYRLVVHRVQEIDGGLRLPVVRDNGILRHGLIQFRYFIAFLVHRLLCQQFVCHFGADEAVDLRRRIFLAVNPFVHFFAEPGLHDIFHLHAQVIALDHALQHEWYRHGITRHIRRDKALESGLHVVGTTSGEHAVNRDVKLRILGVAVHQFA